MNTISRQGTWVIVVTFVVGLVLNTVPLPDVLDRFRPDWMTLILIYWCLAVPHRVGIGWAWVLGLLQDAARGTLLGQHALAMSVVAFLVLRLHKRIRVFPVWQQAASVLVFLLVQQLLVFWINGMIGYPPRDWWYLTPAVGGMLMWPWIFIILRDVRRYYLVT